MKIAIVGAGISGMAAAYFLNPHHDITLFEKDSRVGGHARTVLVPEAGVTHGIDTGFIVYNEHNYPNFTKLLKQLGVVSQPSEMSYAVRADSINFEFCARSLKSLFAQKSNLVRPWFYRLWWDFFKLARHAALILKDEDFQDINLGEYLKKYHYSQKFQKYFLLPMVAAIWSAPVSRIQEFPLYPLIYFFNNHGLLNVFKRPRWRTITGGSVEYVKKITQSFQSKIKLNQSIMKVARHADRVVMYFQDGHEEVFDQIVFATHADQALLLLENPSDLERSVLGAFAYQPNQATLHRDIRLLPRRKQAWAAWNSQVSPSDSDFYLTYCMNILQKLNTPSTYCVSLNCATSIDPASIIDAVEHTHPVYNAKTFAAQKKIEALQGINRTYFCGAYCGYGFHEDGLVSALQVVKKLGVTPLL
jgi:predicted NAD/FAD-binding protein